jgi:hypothetical protein
MPKYAAKPLEYPVLELVFAGFKIGTNPVKAHTPHTNFFFFFCSKKHKHEERC